MWLQAVVRPRFNGDANALGDAFLRVLHRLIHAAAGVPGEGVMKVSDKVVTVLLWCRWRRAYERCARLQWGEDGGGRRCYRGEGK